MGLEVSPPHRVFLRPYLDDQGLLPNGSYMCLDGVARTGNWEEAKRKDPTDLTWLTEWVVAARTGQLDKK